MLRSFVPGDVDAMLIGEALVTAHDTAAKVAALVAAAQDSPVTPAKSLPRSRTGPESSPGAPHDDAPSNRNPHFSERC